METTNALRPELEALPVRLKALPVYRGYPVPWFVQWVKTAEGENVPEFRAADATKWERAIRYKLCWVCGDRLGRFLTFVVGPMCGINRTTAEPPCHQDCAQWSARNCPFLNNPDAIRRVDEKVPLVNDNTPGFSITRNPGVTMLWTTKDYSLFDDGRGNPLIHMGEAESVEWYALGKPATKEQVLRSIEGGIPALMQVAMTQEGAVAVLLEERRKFEKYLPQEA